MAYIPSDKIHVFPAGFRSQDYGTSRLTTEDNLIKFRKISCHEDLINYFTEDPLNSDNYIIGISGYEFIVEKSTLESITAAQDDFYAHIALRDIVVDGKTVSTVLANISTSTDVLDDEGSGEFEGLEITTSIPSENFIQIKDAADGYILQPLRMGADEIAYYGEDGERKPITEAFKTEYLDIDKIKVSIGTGNNVVNLLHNNGDIVDNKSPISYDSNLKVDLPTRTLYIGSENVTEHLTINKSIEVISDDATNSNVIKLGPSSNGVISSDASILKLQKNTSSTLIDDLTNVSSNFYAHVQKKASVNNPPQNSWLKCSSSSNETEESIVTRDNSGEIGVKNLSIGDFVGASDRSFIKATSNGKLQSTSTNNPSYKADAANFGFIRTGFNTTQKMYAVKLSEDGDAYVNVPWTDTIYTPAKATTDTYGCLKVGYNKSGDNYPVQLDEEGKAFVNVPPPSISGYSIAKATTTTVGGIKVSGTTSSTVKPSAVSTTNGRIIGLQLDNSGLAYTVLPLAGEKPRSSATNAQIGGLIVKNIYISTNTESLTIKDMDKADSDKNLLGLQLGSDNVGFVSLPRASKTQLGGIKIIKTYSSALDPEDYIITPTPGTAGVVCYGVQVDSEGKSFVALRNTSPSDIRLKKNISDFKAEKSILDLKIKKFDFVNGEKDQIGCIAQDLQQICPELVNEDENGYLEIKESKLVYLLINEVKTLKAEIEALKEKLS